MSCSCTGRSRHEPVASRRGSHPGRDVGFAHHRAAYPQPEPVRQVGDGPPAHSPPPGIPRPTTTPQRTRPSGTRTRPISSRCRAVRPTRRSSPRQRRGVRRTGLSRSGRHQPEGNRVMRPIRCVTSSLRAVVVAVGLLPFAAWHAWTGVSAAWDSGDSGDDADGRPGIGDPRTRAVSGSGIPATRRVAAPESRSCSWTPVSWCMCGSASRSRQ